MKIRELNSLQISIRITSFQHPFGKFNFYRSLKDVSKTLSTTCLCLKTDVENLFCSQRYMYCPENIGIVKSKCEKRLTITFYPKLNFSKCNSDLCKKDS